MFLCRYFHKSGEEEEEEEKFKLKIRWNVLEEISPNTIQGQLLL